MNNTELEKYKITTTQYFVIFGMIIIGLLLLVIYASITDKTTFWPTLLSQISSALLIGGIWTGFYELLQKKDFLTIHNKSIDRIIDKIPDVDHFEEIGLHKTQSHVSKYDFKDMIDTAKEFTVVINDGRTWVSNNAANLQARFNDKTKKTTFIFLHPNSTFIPCLVDKLGVDEKGYKKKIKETCSLLRELAGENERLEILGHKYFNPQTTFLTESEVVITPYYYSRSRKAPPVFIYRKSGENCYYARLDEDIEALRLDCQEI